MEAMRLIVSIVERGQGKKLQRFYQKRQIPLHLQCAGRGTATSEIMDILGLGSSEKDVLVSWAAHSAARALLSQLDSDLRETLKASGIVFSVPLSGLNSLVASLASYQAESLKKELRGEQQVERTENSVILISCSRGCTDEIMATAKAHGARGGTVVKARLAGPEDLEQAYDMELQEEREILAIVVPTELRGPIMEVVNAQHGLRSKAQSIVCSLPIDEIVRL